MLRHRERPTRLSLTQLLPNALTLAGLCAGMTAIRFAVLGQFDRAVLLILLAAVLDGVDGRLARTLRSESAMGAELDSLCDFVNFGVTPALVLHLWAQGGAGGFAWIAALLYASACALRLARFNISSREAATAPKPKKSFTGVPSPAGAMLVLLPIFVALLIPGAGLHAAVCGLWMIAVAALMVSRLPTPAIPSVRVRPDQARLILLGGLALGAALLTYTWLTLVLLDTAYLLLLAWTWNRHRQSPPAKER